jgi:hypothetical protein
LCLSIRTDDTSDESWNFTHENGPTPSPSSLVRAPRPPALSDLSFLEGDMSNASIISISLPPL